MLRESPAESKSSFHPMLPCGEQNIIQICLDLDKKIDAVKNTALIQNTAVTQDWIDWKVSIDAVNKYKYNYKYISSHAPYISDMH